MSGPDFEKPHADACKREDAFARASGGHFENFISKLAKSPEDAEATVNEQAEIWEVAGKLAHVIAFHMKQGSTLEELGDAVRKTLGNEVWQWADLAAERDRDCEP